MTSQINKNLEEHLQFEQLIADLSARFINVSSYQVDREIENGLKNILEFFKVDRCGLLVTSKDRTTWQVTHLAISEGMRAVPVKTDLPVALFPWAYKKIVEQGQVVCFASIEDLPPEAFIDSQDNPVTLSVNFAALNDGTTYPASAVLNAPNKGLSVSLQDSGYLKMGQ